MLVFGKQFTKGNKSKIGGVIQLFELFKNELNSLNINYEVVDLNWRNYHNRLFAYAYIIYSILSKSRKHSVISFHGTANEFMYLAPIAVLVGKIFNKKVYLRKFAGNFDEVHRRSGFIKKKLIEYALINSHHNFFETKYLVNYFRYFNKTSWFPNVRTKLDIDSSKSYQKKFIFVGHISKEKGVRELLKAFAILKPEYSLCIYGPLHDGFTEHNINSKNVLYGGILDASDVCHTISKFDVLILPSYREGYPGVIIEAFSVGIPVIATSLEGVKEMVTHLHDGILIEPRDFNSIYHSIISLDENTVINMKANAKTSFNHYDSNIVTRRIIRKMCP